MKVHDSIYRTLDQGTRGIILNLFQISTSKELVPIHRQAGGRDCGVHAIAIATALAFNQDPVKIQSAMSAWRSRLEHCLHFRLFSAHVMYHTHPNCIMTVFIFATVFIQYLYLHSFDPYHIIILNKQIHDKVM